MVLVVNHVPSFSYDGMGNITVDNLSNSYTYDAEGRPISAAGVGTTFDPFGRATEQNRNGAYTQIVYSPSGAKFAFMNGTTLIKYKAPMAAGMAAVYNGPNGNPPNSEYFQHADWLGSSRFASTGGGTVAYDRAYAPFGEPYAETATTNRSFTGQKQDTTPGIYDFLFRQQNPVHGRWVSPDPAGLAAVDITNPQTWNRYGYVANDPLNAIDPKGLAMCTYTESGILNCGGYGGGGGGYGAGIGTPGYNPGYCGPWNASCADGQGYYGNTPEWVLTGHWSEDAMRALMGLLPNKSKLILVPTNDYCDVQGRHIEYNLQNRDNKDYYVREAITSNGNETDYVNGAQLNAFSDWINNGVGRPDNTVSQRFLLSPNDPARNTSGSFPVQIQRTLGGWPVNLDSQGIERKNNGDVIVAGTPCPK